MRANISIGKVTVFCVHDDALLVFDHPTAGTQVPAGTMRPGEDPRDAAKRELAEETGVGKISIVANIGVVESQLAADRAVALQDLEADDGRFAARGWPLQLTDDSDPQRWTHETWDYDVRPPLLLDRHTGLAPATALAARVRRHFFVATAQELPEGESWWQFADGWEWRVRWAPIDDDLRLHGEQFDWVSMLRAHLGA